MEFRRSGASDERRRRVLRDEITGGQDEEAASIPITSKRDRARRYTDGALAENLPRVADFLPKRAFSLLVLALLLLTAAAAVVTCHIILATTGLLAKEPRLAMFDLLARGNIAQWLAGLQLAGIALLSLVIYKIRLHRVDDFRGRYRVWLLAAGLFLFLSLDVVTGVHQAISACAEAISGGPALGSADGWWFMLYTAGLGAFAIRLLIEMRANRWGVTLATAGCAFSLLAGLQLLGAFSPSDPLERTVTRASITLVGQWSLAVGVIIYARHVFLDAQGLLTAVEPRKKKTRAKAKEKENDSEEKSTDEKKTSAKTAGTSSTTTKTAADSSDEDEDEEDLLGDRQLSRSERKRLKKMQQNQSGRRAA